MEDKGTIVITDCKDIILQADEWRAQVDYSIFHTTPVRTLSAKAVLDDCSFLELYINHKTSWGAPIPSTFQRFLPDLLAAMSPLGGTMILNVVDYGERRFDPAKHVEEFLKPNNYRYFFLEIESDMTGQRPALFFECPIDRVGILEDIAFRTVDNSTEGYILEPIKIPLFRKWHRMGNTDVMLRDLLRNVQFAFRLWHDNNGVVIYTDKFDGVQLMRLVGSKLEDQIASYIREWGASPGGHIKGQME